MGFRATWLLICSIVLPINLNSKSFNFSHLENGVSNRIHFIKVLRGLTELIHGAGFSTEQTACYTFPVSPPNFTPREIKMTILKSVFQYSEHLLIGTQEGVRYTSWPQGAHSLFGEVRVWTQRGAVGQTRKNEAPPLLHLPPHFSGPLFSKTLPKSSFYLLSPIPPLPFSLELAPLRLLPPPPTETILAKS